MDLARLDTDLSRRTGSVSNDDLQTPSLMLLFENRGLRADGEHVPALKGIDGLVWHDTDERGLNVECFGRAPVEPHDRIERWRYCRCGRGRR